MFQESIKKSFECSITKLIIKRPVIAADGHTYEQGAIEEWFENKKTSPLTGEPIPNTNLIPNHHLKSQIEGFMDSKKKGIAEAIQEIKRQGDVVREYDELYRSNVDKLGKRARMKTKEVEELKTTIEKMERDIKSLHEQAGTLNKQLGVARKQNAKHLEMLKLCMLEFVEMEKQLERKKSVKKKSVGEELLGIWEPKEGPHCRVHVVEYYSKEDTGYVRFDGIPSHAPGGIETVDEFLSTYKKTDMMEMTWSPQSLLNLGSLQSAFLNEMFGRTIGEYVGTDTDTIQGCVLMHGPRRVVDHGPRPKIVSNHQHLSPIPREGEVWDETNPTYTCFDRSTSIKVSKFTGGRVYFQYLPHRGWVDSQPHDLLWEQFLQDYQRKKIESTPQELEDLPELDGEDDSSDFELE